MWLGSISTKCARDGAETPKWILLAGARYSLAPGLCCCWVPISHRVGVVLHDFHGFRFESPRRARCAPTFASYIKHEGEEASPARLEKMSTFGGNPFAPPGASGGDARGGGGGGAVAGGGRGGGSGFRGDGDFVVLSRGRETCLSARIIEHRSFDPPSGSLTGSSHIKFSIISEIAKPQTSAGGSPMRCESARVGG